MTGPPWNFPTPTRDFWRGVAWTVATMGAFVVGGLVVRGWV